MSIYTDRKTDCHEGDGLMIALYVLIDEDNRSVVPGYVAFNEKMAGSRY